MVVIYSEVVPTTELRVAERVISVVRPRLVMQLEVNDAISIAIIIGITGGGGRSQPARNARANITGAERIRSNENSAGKSCL